MSHHYDSSSSSLVPPLIFKPSKVDLEAGSVDQFQCRICLENDGEDLIAPCKCKGTSKYVHRECLDQWRAVKEGFAFSHCTTCKAPFYLRVNDLQRKWRTLKFRFFVTTNILFIFLAVQLVIASLGYLVYVIDTHEKFWLRLHWGFGSELGFYYICDLVGYADAGYLSNSHKARSQTGYLFHTEILLYHDELQSSPLSLLLQIILR